MQEFDSKKLRKIFGQYPTGVTIITTVDSSGKPVGMTANSFASVSLSPPMVLWSVDKGGNTHDAYTESLHFCVHILSEDQEDLSNRFAGAETDRFREMNWSEGVLGSPLLTECSCRIECEKVAVYPGGDHSIIIGRVVNVDSNESQRPLLFHQGRYRSF